MEKKAIELTEQSEMRLGILPARTPHDIIVQATTIATELSKIIKDKKLSNAIQGRQFVRVEGWSTMGAMLGVLPCERPELGKRFEDGSYEAIVELVRINDGAVIGRASALVGMDEKDRNGKPTWANRSEYARKSMAITRATGKAFRLGFSWIMTLAGYEATPAEEMTDVVEGQFQEAPTEPVTTPASNGNANKPPAQPEQGDQEIVLPPKIQALIEAKVSPDVADAAGVLNLIKADKLRVEDTVTRAKIYRAWRDLDSTPKMAAEKAIAGISPS